MNLCPPNHKHAVVGTCYVIHKCRCDECRAGNAARERRRTRLKAYGRYDSGLVPAEPVRAHIVMLQASGMGWKRISEVAGVGKTAVSQLIYGRHGTMDDPRKGEVLKRFSRVNAEKLLAVQPVMENLRPGAIVDGRSVARRVQALVAIGWSLKRQGEYIGRDATNMSPLVKGLPVSKATHDKVCAMFDDLWNKKPPMDTHQQRGSYTRAIRHAKCMKWVPPLAWDDIDTDETPVIVDEPFLVDEFAIDSLILGHEVQLTTAERKHAALRLLSDGKSVREISQLIKTHERVIERWRAA